MCGITRGTTPLLVFRLPFNIDEFSEVWVTLGQNNEVVVNKTLNQCEYSENILSIHLTQEDTLQLDSRNNTSVQIRARTHEGESLASNIITVRTNDILKDGVI